MNMMSDGQFPKVGKRQSRPQMFTFTTNYFERLEKEKQLETLSAFWYWAKVSGVAVLLFAMIWVFLAI